MQCIEYLFYVGANNNEEKFLDLKIYETIKLVRGWKLHRQIAASRLVWPSQAGGGEKNIQAKLPDDETFIRKICFYFFEN